MSIMKRPVFLTFILVYLLLISGSNVAAQVTPSVSANGRIFAEIIPVFSASDSSELNFGKFSPGPKGGKIILTPENTISVQGSVFKSSSHYNAASFYLTGDMGAAFSVSLPKNPVILTHSSDNKTMLVEGWASNPSPGIGTGMLQEGYQIIFVGATLKVGPINDNPVGLYTGSYTITFDFN
jgi:hypothetical protein